MDYSINLGEWNSVFAVPCSVVDKNLKLAGGVQLKVLLWVLRHSGEEFKAEDISDAIGIDKADVCDAMLYWQETGLVKINDGKIAPAQSDNDKKAEPAFAAENVKATSENDKAQKVKHVLTRPEKPDNAFVAKRINESKEISCLMQSSQEILGRLISNGESATLLMIHDEFGLPSDVIIMLLQYAKSIGKANMRYIEKVAMNWADNGITTHEKAEEMLSRLVENRQAWDTVQEALRMPRRTPSSKEEAFAVTWIKDWNFSSEMIREAYDRAVDNTGKFSASYMNKILERWHKSNITTSKEAEQEKMDRAASHKSAKGKSLTFDIDEYERTSVYDSKE